MYKSFIYILYNNLKNGLDRTDAKTYIYDCYCDCGIKCKYCNLFLKKAIYEDHCYVRVVHIMYTYILK